MFELVLQPDEKVLQPYCGAAVCVIMKDGTRKIGRLTACGAGRLVLNGEEGEIPKARVARKKGGRARSSREMPAAYEDEPYTDGGWGGLSIAPIGMEPHADAAARETIPLRAIESVVIL